MSMTIEFDQYDFYWQYYSTFKWKYLFNYPEREPTKTHVLSVNAAEYFWTSNTTGLRLWVRVYRLHPPSPFIVTQP